MIQSVEGKMPSIPHSAYVHSTAVVIGDVTLGANTSVWPGAVIRGDLAQIVIGARTNIQDGCVLHTGKLKLTVGDGVSVGHRAVLHSCDIGSGTVVGMGAIIMNAAKIGENCIIGAGTLIPGGKVIPPGSVVVGNPYSIIRPATPEEIEENVARCERYMAFAKLYKRTGNIL